MPHNIPPRYSPRQNTEPTTHAYCKPNRAHNPEAKSRKRELIAICDGREHVYMFCTWYWRLVSAIKARQSGLYTRSANASMGMNFKKWLPRAGAGVEPCILKWFSDSLAHYRIGISPPLSIHLNPTNTCTIHLDHILDTSLNSLRNPSIKHNRGRVWCDENTG
jgi:hypothetical protein